MKMIYRLEKDGKGVFSACVASKLPCALLRRAYNHPGPCDEREATADGKYPLTKRTSQHRFGFTTLTQGRSWFTRRACLLMNAKGATLSVYRADAVEGLIEGNFQCVFIPKGEPLRLPASALHWTRAEIEARLIDHLYRRDAA